ncbi:MAG: isochorismatase family cysteine hydrolase [Methanocorpusculum sp.]|nr:isochorismatase family cysteine hydrolase [Methanocorpusculum sp.]
MQNKALVVIDLQNDITKNYKEIIDHVNALIDRAEKQGLYIIYIRHENITAGTRTFKPGTKGAELVPELHVVSDHIFVKTKSNALTSAEFSAFISKNEITEFYVCGADATACVKSTCYNMSKTGYKVTVLPDCVTSYDKKKIPEMLAYYEKKGCSLKTSEEVISGI